MDARTQRTVYRLVALFLAAGAGDALIQFATSSTGYDYRHLIGALVAAAIMAAEQYLKSSGPNASPTVAAVNTALENNALSVPPPKIAVSEPTPVAAPVSEATPVATPPQV